MSSEAWKGLKGVVDYGDNYEVSTLGKIRNIKSGKYLGGEIDHRGYRRVVLCLKGKTRRYLVHRLVALCFIPNVEGKEQVNHIDGNKLNNCLSNLEWCSPKENVRHAIANGRFGGANCARKPVAEYSMRDGSLLAVYESTMDAMRKTGIDQSTISLQCRMKSSSRRNSYFRYITEEVQKRAT